MHLKALILIVVTSGAVSIGLPASANPEIPYAPACHVGGNCLATRDFVAEVQLRPYGKIKAWIYPQRDELREVSLLQVNVNALGSDGVRHRVGLVWDPAKHFFVGYMPARVRPKAGPLQVFVLYQGKTRQATGVASITPHPKRGGLVMAAGPAALEVLAFQDGRVEAFAMGVKGTVQGSPQLLTHTQNGAPMIIALKYSAKHARYLGQLTGGVFAVSALELQVRSQGTLWTTAHDLVKPLPPSELQGSQVMVGPYSVEVAKLKNDKLVALVRDGTQQLIGGRDVDVTLDLYNDAEENNTGNIFSLAMRWNPDTIRFEGILPKTYMNPLWFEVKVQPLRTKNDVHEDKWRGSSEWLAQQ